MSEKSELRRARKLNAMMLGALEQIHLTAEMALEEFHLAKKREAERSKKEG